MSKLNDILSDAASTLYCMGQDWTKGDGSASNVDAIADKVKQQIKDLVFELIGEDEFYHSASDDGDSEDGNILYTDKLRQKVEEL